MDYDYRPAEVSLTRPTTQAAPGSDDWLDQGLGNAAMVDLLLGPSETPDQEVTAAPQSEPQSEPLSYSVASGDSLSAIAGRYGVTVAELAAANGIENINLIYVGQNLVIPGHTAPTADEQVDPGTVTQVPLPADVSQDALGALTATVLEVVPASQQQHGGVGVPAILRQCAAAGITNPSQVAYILATAQHESHFGTPMYERSESLVEDRNPFRQNADGSWSARVHVNGETVTAATQEELEIKYWDAAYGGMLGNEEGTTDARDYRGRGYVQITGENNYRRMSTQLQTAGFSYTVDGVTYGGTDGQPIDLAAHPEHVNQVPDLAARILVSGMTSGSFTGRALGDYVNDGGTDFVNARRVVNGDTATNGASIASTASTYLRVLQGAWASIYGNQGS